MVIETDRYMEKVPAPKLSVVVPVYNVEDYLRDALMSLLNQTFIDFEIIAINDGSTDGSGEILNDIAQSDQRLHSIEQNNRGLAATRNRGFKESRGKYIYFFDSDDLLDKNAFMEMITFAERRSFDVLNIGSEAIDEYGKSTKIVRQMQFEQLTPISGEELFYKLCRSGNYPANVQKYMYRRDYLMYNRLLFDEGFIHEDEAFSMKALCLAEKAGALPECFIKKRFRSDSIMSSNRGIRNAEGWAKAVQSLLEFKHEHDLLSTTKKYLDERVYQLSKNIINLYNELPEEEKQKTSLRELLPVKIVFSKSFMLSLEICIYRVFVLARNICKKVPGVNRN